MAPHATAQPTPTSARLDATPSGTQPHAPSAPPKEADSHPEEVFELGVGENRRIDVPGLSRFLAGNPDVVSVLQAGPSTVQVTGVKPGRTFVHVWGTSGRRTLVVNVVWERFEAPLRRGPPLSPEAELLERSEPLEIGYDVTFESVRRGENYRDADRNTTNILRHTVTPRMPTPYGLFSSLARFSRSNERQDLDTWVASLRDGRLGPVRDFDFTVGDTSTPFGGTFVPTTGYRGGTFQYRGLHPWEGTMLWGQELSTVFAQPLAGAEKAESFVAGAGLEYNEPQSPWSTLGTVMFGYGNARQATNSDYVADLQSRVRVVPPLHLEGEVAVNDHADYVYTAGSVWHARRSDMRVTWRDIDPNYQSLTGSVNDQGERGVRAEGSLQMTPTIALGGTGDFYQTRQFQNPNDPGAINQDLFGRMSWELTRDTRVYGDASYSDTSGFFSPSRDKGWGVGGTQRLWTNRLLPPLPYVDVSGQVSHQESRSVPTPQLDFDAETYGVGASVPLPLGFTADAAHDWTQLQELATGSRSGPRRLTLGLSHSSSLGPFSLSGRTSYERQRETGALRSQLSGENRMLGEAGVSMEPTDWASMFLNGRVEHVEFESGAEAQMEFGLFTGARVVLNTGVRWDKATSVRGIVFRDVNGDGVRQPDEPGIKGVRIVAGIAKRTTTDKEGQFSFWRVAGKAVPISLDLKTLPAGYALSTPRTIVIRPGEQAKPFLAFGALARGEVRGRVFYDVDNDKKQTIADRGLEGVRVELGGRVVQTDRSGWFFFRQLPSGPYAVTLVLSSVPTRFLPTVPVRQQLTLPDGGVVNIDYPLTMQRVLEGHVYVDANRNGARDLREEGVSNISVCVDGQRATKTDQMGHYRFEDMAVGTHHLVLNCGMPLRGLIPLSDAQPTLTITPDDPEATTVDFRLDRLPELPDTTSIPEDYGLTDDPDDLTLPGPP